MISYRNRIPSKTLSKEILRVIMGQSLWPKTDVSIAEAVVVILKRVDAMMCNHTKSFE
jgi:hypothetical protein